MSVSRIMTDDRFDLRGKRIALWNYILQTELAHGTQFLVAQDSGHLYAVVDDDGVTTVLPMPKSGRGGDRWFSYFHTMYGIGEREDWNKFIYDSLRSYVIKHGTRVEVRRFAAYKPVEQTVYMSGYNGRMYKIDGSGEVVDLPIGEDGVFFVDDDPGRHELPDIGQHNMLIERLVNQVNFLPRGLGGITIEQQRKALTVWMFALAFPDLLPAKPILLIEGQYGSGKSTVVQLIQLVLTGDENPTILQRDKGDDFGVILLRSPICLLDNLDSYIDWIPDAIAAYTTLGRWNKRKLFTDDENMVIKPHAFLAVASRNPASFRREDVADRCVILRLERRRSFVDMGELRAQLLTDRPQLLGEYLWYVDRIVARLRATRGSRSEEFRMAGFVRFARIVGEVMGWPETEVSEVMSALQGERDAFVNEEDPLCDILNKWIAYKPKNGPSNIGRIMTAAQLHGELNGFAMAAQVTWHDTPRTLGQKMKSTQVERQFHVERLTVAGQPAFRIWRHTDARLELVEDEDEGEVS